MKASKEPLDHSGAHWSPSVRDLQSSSSACTSVSVSARRFASWTALTPLRVGKRLNLSGLARQPSSTRVSAVPWRLGPKLVSIYGSPIMSNFLRPKRLLRVFRNWPGGPWRVGSRIAAEVELGKVRYKYGLCPSILFLSSILLSAPQFFFALIPLNLFCFQNSVAGERVDPS